MNSIYVTFCCSLSIVPIRPSNLSFVSLGVLLMLIAFAGSNVTMAQDSYAGTLVTAMICRVLALACFAVPLVRGPIGWRVAAVIPALPMLFIVPDFLRRAPNVFGGG